jgi:hypothetical protein
MIFLAVAAFWSLGVFSRAMDESIEKKIPKIDSPSDDRKVAKLSSQELVLRSDHLDKIRSNLRNGISILMGIGSALLLWISSTTIFRPETHRLLLISSLCLIIMAILGILFSFRNPSERSKRIILNEGLVPKKITVAEYETQLELVIDEKVEILSSMRTLISFGLLLFTSAVILAQVAPFYVNFPSIPEGTAIEGIGALAVWIWSGMSLFLVLGRLGYLIIGRHFLGIIGVSASEFMPTKETLEPKSTK